MDETVATWTNVGVTFLLGVIGFDLAYSYRRQTRIQIAEAPLAAYGRLWEITKVAAPSRLDGADPKGPLSKDERKTLYSKLTDWYYEGGDGMLLAPVTQAVFLSARWNLVRSDAQLRPGSLLLNDPVLQDLSSEEKRGRLAIRQLSLLRTQMKADLAILGAPSVGALASHERRFLKHCGVSLLRPPWLGVTEDEKREIDKEVLNRPGFARGSVSWFPAV